MKPVIIVANGTIKDQEWLQKYLRTVGSTIIAADGGGIHLAAISIRPLTVIGDLDSLPTEIWQAWETAGTKIIRFPEEKDETDLELALLLAVEFYEVEIEVLGALGGRLDQMMANILLLAHPALAKRKITLVEPDQRAWLVREETEINGRKGDRVSLIPLGGDVLIQRTSGLQWPLQDELLQFGPARGISNVMVENKSFVEVKSGMLLCVHLTGSL